VSSAQVAKLTMGYQLANQRPACKNCHHVQEQREDRMPPYDTVRWQCKKGGFLTSAMATCNQHQPFVKKGA
jgi:hypothetical protein